MSVEHPALHRNLASAERFEQRVVHSALWAAAGDALGWITELSRGQSGIEHRAGVTSVQEPISWKRTIGGRNGPRVNLPAGTYSDDTQLRLAVSRSIRGNGAFDVEAFAKIEVTVWPTYALGGGLGTKAAALNLSRRGVNWFSNFFNSGAQQYVNGGGNGAAMRIQPHVWASRGTEDLILNVMRDSLVTHGHPHGFCGAVFHALALINTIENGEIPGPNIWTSFAEQFENLSKLIARDPQLATFWRSAWENDAGASLDNALLAIRDEALRDIDQVAELVENPSESSYRSVLERLGCLTPQFRGSGFKTALAALALARIHRKGDVEQSLVQAANEFDSDTDTIGTMTGALLGAISSRPPEWKIQDREYIIREAKRLAAIALKLPQDSFTYPDLGRWNPPTKQTASIGLSNGGFAIAGLGALIPSGIEYPAGDAIWQWFALPFGQTILAKRRVEVKNKIPIEQLPGLRQEPRVVQRAQKSERLIAESQSKLPLENDRGEGGVRDAKASSLTDQRSVRDVIDAWSDEIIHSNFDDRTLGRLLNRCIESTQSIEQAIALAAIVAKAKLARQRRRG